MALFQLIYLSSLVTDEPEILSAILDSSVRNNKRRDITGMMLYQEGKVMQVLEGEKGNVIETFQAIQLDVRHQDIFVLIEEEITSRKFATWSMGFRQLSQADFEKFTGATNVFKARSDEIKLRVQPSEVRSILKSFAEGSISIS
jgi:hypothetical protein